MTNDIITAEGTIVHGNHIGRTIGIPTINIFPSRDVTGIKRGVYCSTITFLDGSHRGKTYKGITNVGCKPTVQDNQIINFETHIFDFSDDVYKDKVSIDLLKFTRPEMKFDSIEALTSQMQSDILDAKEFFNQQIVKQTNL